MRVTRSRLSRSVLSTLLLWSTACTTTTTAAKKPSTIPVSAEGSDVSTLPQRFADGDWLPIAAPLLSMQLKVKVVVNGKEHLAVLDTGAQRTAMSVPVADALGLVATGGQDIRVLDANGDLIMGQRRRAGRLQLGKRTFKDVEVTVLSDHPSLFLVGQDLLQHVDLFIAADEGLVGLFPAGKGPKLKGAVAVNLVQGIRQLRVKASAPNVNAADVDFQLLVDTGASGTSVPVMLGVNNGLPADLRYEVTSVAVGGEQQRRGRFVLHPLTLGSSQSAEVGKVLALGSTMHGGDSIGLLGNDVMMRFYTVISTHDAEMRFAPMPWRPAVRMRGPGGQVCLDNDGNAVPCVEVKLVPFKGTLPKDALPGVCLEATAHKAFAQKTVEMAVVAYSKKRETLFNGGALRVFLTVGKQGESRCFSLWKSLELLDVGPDVLLSLRFVRTEDVRWPCDPMQTTCVSFTGPVPGLDLRDEVKRP